jgi:hypothetical protein
MSDVTALYSVLLKACFADKCVMILLLCLVWVDRGVYSNMRLLALQYAAQHVPQAANDNLSVGSSISTCTGEYQVETPHLSQAHCVLAYQ